MHWIHKNHLLGKESEQETDGWTGSEREERKERETEIALCLQ